MMIWKSNEMFILYELISNHMFADNVWIPYKEQITMYYVGK